MTVFSASLHEGSKAEPPYTAFLQPKLNGAPSAPEDTGYKRAAEQERARRKRNAARTPFPNTGQLAQHYLRYIISGEVAGAWQKLGGMGAPLTHLARFS